MCGLERRAVSHTFKFWEPQQFVHHQCIPHLMHLRTHALKRKSSRSPTKTAGFYADSIKPKSTNTSPAGKRARSSKSRRVHSPPPKPSSALIHQPAAAAAATRPLQLRVTLGRNSRARSTAPRETSAAATTEEKQLEVAAASSSSSSSSAPESASKRSDADRPLFRSEAVKMAKWHMTPWGKLGPFVQRLSLSRRTS